MKPETPNTDSPAPRKKYVRAIGPRLRVLLYFIFGLVAILAANSVYLSAITFLEWLKTDPNTTYQNWFYMVMFGTHLGLGFLLVLPVVIFGFIHMKNAHDRPNRRAVKVGYLLFAASLVILVTGLLLTRIDIFQFKNVGLKNPDARSVAYWAHVLTPILAVWLYILHRLAGPRIQWRLGLRWGAAVGVIVIGMIALHSAHPKKNPVGSPEGKKYFEPSLARTASGNFIPAKTLMMDDYCLNCHQDAYNGWFHSAHRFSSFNNKPYLFSVRETRQVALQRDGDVKAARWCAGCHDVVPFFSGAFDDPNFDDVNHPTSQAGITCTACHAITHVNSTKGNADYTIDEPIHYPFAYSTNRLLQYINQQLVKAKPEFHKKTFLKPVMRTAEYCSTCHKVSIPQELTKYKEFLRGQNHYDTFLLSGVSGHGARSFYYPEKAQPNCAGCHMPLKESEDFGANFFNDANLSTRYIHSHLFPGANTGIPHLRGDTNTIKAQEEFLKGSLRVDIFGVKEGGLIDSPLTAPLRPQVPALKRGQRYLLEVVLRTLKLGHPFTQGTVDSNEIWVDTTITSRDKVIGRNGGLGPHREVDPWSHFVNVYMLDRNGNRVDRRNPQDIFTPLYNHQIPPGAGRAVHYEFVVPETQNEPLTVEVKLQYRKFDTIYMNYVFDTNYVKGAPFTVTNDLPITTIASDKITFPIAGVNLDAAQLAAIAAQTSNIPVWQRWNDYGIGLFLEGNVGAEKGQLIQATEAFEQVEKLGRADGAINLARVYFKEGRLEDTVAALQRAAKFEVPAPPWTVAWFNGLVNKQNGFLDKAITEFRSILEDRYPDLEQRGFDFSKDYEVINELGQTYFERAKMERGNPERQKEFLNHAVETFKKTLNLDSENLTAHYNLALIYAQLGDETKAAHHRQEHSKYLPDYNAQDRAVSIARRADPAANHAAQATVIYPLQRVGAPELDSPNKTLSAAK
ncbi:MAG TPA: multiheme c-type cytochrome [Verrucomicrobiae bacterium]|nr:multiheme c-type cytochrome [Verrucomicrobiae bacterium]